MVSHTFDPAFTTVQNVKINRHTNVETHHSTELSTRTRTKSNLISFENIHYTHTKIHIHRWTNLFYIYFWPFSRFFLVRSVHFDVWLIDVERIFFARNTLDYIGFRVRFESYKFSVCSFYIKCINLNIQYE